MVSRGLLLAPVETFSIFLTVNMDAGSNTCTERTVRWRRVPGYSSSSNYTPQRQNAARSDAEKKLRHILETKQQLQRVHESGSAKANAVKEGPQTASGYDGVAAAIKCTARHVTAAVSFLAHLAEHHMNAVKPSGLRCCHEELAAIRVRPAICHGQKPGTCRTRARERGRAEFKGGTATKNTVRYKIRPLRFMGKRGGEAGQHACINTTKVAYTPLFFVVHDS